MSLDSKPGKTRSVDVCLECEEGVVQCGNHWHHVTVPAQAHFPSV